MNQKENQIENKYEQNENVEENEIELDDELSMLLSKGDELDKNSHNSNSQDEFDELLH